MGKIEDPGGSFHMKIRKNSNRDITDFQDGVDSTYGF